MKSIFTKSSDTRSGFTLIELLVVIAIIGLLASIVLASLNTARKKSRDARRIADMKQLQNALELFANDNRGNYPICATPGNCTQAAGEDFNVTAVPTLTATYMTSIPQDPLSTVGTPYYYKYKTNQTPGPTVYCIGTTKYEGTGTAIPNPASTCNIAAAPAGVGAVPTGSIYSVGN